MNLGSLGRPSEPMLFLAKLLSVKIRLASSKSTFCRFMMLLIVRLPASSRPGRISPEERLSVRSKVSDVRPSSISLAKEECTRV